MYFHDCVDGYKHPIYQLVEDCCLRRVAYVQTPVQVRREAFKNDYPLSLSRYGKMMDDGQQRVEI